MWPLGDCKIMKLQLILRKVFLSLIFVGAAGFATTAAAQIESVMQPYIVTTNDKGEEFFATAAEAEPGDVIEYRVTYTNNGQEAVHGLVVTGPIPNQTQYVSNSSVAGATSSFVVSIDDGNTWDTVPVKRTRKKADGTEIEVIIPASEYDKVRWNVKDRLAAGAAQEFKYRVQVNEP